METTKTELHTHLLGMLSSRELINMIKEYTDYIYWPINERFSENSSLVPVDSLINNENFINMLSIKRGSVANYYDLNKYYDLGSSILAYLSMIMFISGGKKPFKLNEIFNKFLVDEDVFYSISDKLNTYTDKTSATFAVIYDKVYEIQKFSQDESFRMKSLVYSDYINRSLKELINMGIKYVEPSYSYSSIISGINLDSDVNDKICCRFLLSTDRDRSVKQTKYSLDDLKKALDSNKTVGFDIMGIEEALPLSYTTYGGNQSKSLKRKLELITELFASYPNTNTVLRIHSGETPVSLNNTIWILNALREIKESYDYDIFPPPEIRIGHGVYFQESDLYIELLREVNATIEINASSNLALGNIPTTNILPYDYYLEHGIKVVLSTDGHGLYDTDIRREDFIAQNVSKHFDMLFNIDNEVLKNKTDVIYEESRGVKR